MKLDRIDKAAGYVRQILSDFGLVPEVGIILGNGLEISRPDPESVVIPYKGYPGNSPFPQQSATRAIS